MTEQNVKTIGSQLADNALRYPDQDALVFPERCRYSWGELDAAVGSVACGMLAAGAGRGTHLALWSPNRAEWALTFLAAARIGAVVISLDTSLQGPELKQQLSHSDAELLFMAPGVKQNEYLDIVAELLPQADTADRQFPVSADFPRLRVVVVFGERQDGLTGFSDFIAQGKGVTAEQLEEISRQVTVDDLVNIQYTSAAFGTPKGVMLSQRAILLNGAITGSNLGFSHIDRLCLPLPFFHAFGCSLGLMLCLEHGATLVAMERFTPEGTLKAVSDEKCTALHGVPTMFLAQLEAETFCDYDLSSLRTGIMAGAPCPVEVMVAVMEKMAAREVTIAYGQTEAGPLITQTPVDEPARQRVATVGRPLHGVEVKVVDPVSGTDAADEAEGEICARSDMLMRGYYKMPQETSMAIDPDGWLHTGDLAIRDSAGRYRITGRLRNMIIRGGQNIYPVEIETCLLQMPGIKQAKVFGVEDRKLGEIVAAQIVPDDECAVDTEAVRDFCQDKIAHYKVPSMIEIVTSL